MSPSATLLAPVETDHQTTRPAAIEAHQQPLFPDLQAGAERYLSDSETYEVRGGIIAEVIRSPFLKFIEEGITKRVVDELRVVTLLAFGKGPEQSEEYTPDKVMLKNAIFVDWLTVYRLGGKVIAYTSATHMGKDTLYLNAAMVDPAYQAKSCLGILGHLYVWKKICDERNDMTGDSLRIVMRTRNRDVANIMTHVLNHFTVSGETPDSEFRELFIQSGELTRSNYDPKTGINQDVYPVGLPNGSLSHGDRINQAFDLLGPCDAHYLGGIVRYLRVVRIIAKEVLARRYYSDAVIHELRTAMELAA